MTPYSMDKLRTSEQASLLFKMEVKYIAGNTRNRRLHIMVSREENQLIKERMAEAGNRNRSAFIRKMAMDGYAVHADLSEARELVSLQRRCVNNLKQIAKHAEEHNVYQTEIAELQEGYAVLWEQLSEILKRLAGIITL